MNKIKYGEYSIALLSVIYPIIIFILVKHRNFFILHFSWLWILGFILLLGLLINYFRLNNINNTME
jgi:hypothetical protein